MGAANPRAVLVALAGAAGSALRVDQSGCASNTTCRWLVRGPQRALTVRCCTFGLPPSPALPPRFSTHDHHPPRQALLLPARETAAACPPRLTRQLALRSRLYHGLPVSSRVLGLPLTTLCRHGEEEKAAGPRCCPRRATRQAPQSFGSRSYKDTDSSAAAS